MPGTGRLARGDGTVGLAQRAIGTSRRRPLGQCAEREVGSNGLFVLCYRENCLTLVKMLIHSFTFTLTFPFRPVRKGTPSAQYHLAGA